MSYNSGNLRKFASCTDCMSSCMSGATTVSSSDDTICTRTIIIVRHVVYKVNGVLCDVINLCRFKDLTVSSENKGQGCDEKMTCCDKNLFDY